MNFELKIETVINETTKVMKEKYKDTLLYRKLQRHESVGNFNCWRELSVYQLGKWIKDNFKIDVHVYLEGNNSNLFLMYEPEENEFKKLNSRLLKMVKAVGDS